MIAETGIQMIVVSSISVTVVCAIGISMSFAQMVIAVKGSTVAVPTHISMAASIGILGAAPISLIYRVDLLFGKDAVMAIVVMSSNTTLFTEGSVGNLE